MIREPAVISAVQTGKWVSRMPIESSTTCLLMWEKEGSTMLSYWFPTPLAAWVPLVLAIGFALLAVVAIVATLARQREERDANLFATLYGVGFGLAALSEFLMYLDVQFGWSLASALSISAGVATFFAVVAGVVAVVAIVLAALMQFQEEGSYRTAHAH